MRRAPRLSTGSHPLRGGAPEQPAGPEEQHQQDHDEGDRVLVARRDETGPEGFKDAQQQATRDRPHRVAHPAQDGGGKALQPQHHPRVVGREGDGSDQHSRHCPQQRGEPVGQQQHPADVDPHERGRGRVAGAGEQRLADRRPAKEPAHHQDEDRGAAHDPQILRQQRRAAELQRRLAGEVGHRVEVLAPDQLGQAAQEDRGPDGDDDQRDHRGAAGGLDRELLQCHADRHRRQRRQHQRDQERRARRDQADGRHRPDHHELPLREIHDVGGVVDDREAEPDQRVDRADGDAGDEELRELVEHGERGQGPQVPAPRGVSR